MEVGYGQFQLSGVPVNEPSVNQHKNSGGITPGFFAEFYSPHGKLVLTSRTVGNLTELEATTSALLAMLLDGDFVKVPVSRDVQERARGIVS